MKVRLWVAGFAAAGCLTVALPAVIFAGLAGTAATTADSQCLADLPDTAATVGTTLGLTDDQRSNAADIIAVGEALVGTEGEVIAVDTAITESDLEDLPGGTGTSVGLFQQIDSWGTVAERMDPVWSSTAFYEHLLAVPGWQQMQVWQAAQAVQQSGAGAATDGAANYGPFVGEAQAIVAASGQGPTPPQGACDTGVLPNGLPATVQQAIEAAPARAQAAVGYALAQVGKPYVWGATGPNAFDCSGLTMESYLAAGLDISRTTYTQVAEGADVTGGPYAPGDLIFPDAGHVELYIGGGYVVQAPHTGTNVQISPVPAVWQARRIVDLSP